MQISLRTPREGMSFRQLFETVTARHSPFPGQTLLVECRKLPWIVDAPRGAGKTAVAVSMLAVGVLAVVLAGLWPPTFSQRRTISCLVVTLAMRVVVADLWAAVEKSEQGSPGRPVLSP